MPVMILVALWSSFDVGFLSMLSGMLNVNKEIYEAAHLDGIRNRIQEIIYVTIPSIRPQMLFGAVMALVGTFNSAGLGVSAVRLQPHAAVCGLIDRESCGRLWLYPLRNGIRGCAVGGVASDHLAMQQAGL